MKNVLSRLAPLGALAAALALSGCASLNKTPSAVKEQAAQGMSLIAGMEAALKSYRAEEKTSHAYLLAVTGDVVRNTSTNRKLLGDNQLAMTAASNAQGLAFQSKLNTMLDGLASVAASGTSFEDYVQGGQKLLTPPANSTEATTAAQAALAELTKDFPSKVAVKEWLATARAIEKGAKDLKIQVEDAKKVAAAK